MVCIFLRTFTDILEHVCCCIRGITELATEKIVGLLNYILLGLYYKQNIEFAKVHISFSVYRCSVKITEYIKS